MAQITQMTTVEITGRIEAIKRDQAAHEARNFDAELAEVMRQGGDVDALEEKHLEAERKARRMRVERSALEAELPLAIQREAEEQFGVLAERHAALEASAQSASGAVVDAWGALVAAIEAWNAVQKDAEAITHEALKCAETAKTAVPQGLGLFNDPRLGAIIKVWNTREDELKWMLQSAERGVDLGQRGGFRKTDLPLPDNDNQPQSAA